MLLDLICAGIAIHSPHTAFDSAANGINQQLAEGLNLTEIQPLEPAHDFALTSDRAAGERYRSQRRWANSPLG